MRKKCEFYTKYASLAWSLAQSFIETEYFNLRNQSESNDFISILRMQNH